MQAAKSRQPGNDQRAGRHCRAKVHPARTPSVVAPSMTKVLLRVLVARRGGCLYIVPYHATCDLGSSEKLYLTGWAAT